MNFPLALDAMIAWRNIWRQRRRTFAVLLAIAAGVIAMMMTGGFVEWMIWALRESTIHSQVSHLQVAKQGFQIEGRADPRAFLLPEDAIPAAVSNDRSVKVLSPRLVLSGLISHGEETIPFIGEALNIDKEADQLFGMVIEAGEAMTPGDEERVWLGRGLAKALDAPIGEPVVLVLQSAGGGVRAVEARFAGVFSTISKAYDDNAIRMPIGLARELMGESANSYWVAYLNDTDDTDAAIERLTPTLNNAGLEVTPWYRLADYYTKTETLLRKQLSVVSIIVLMVVLLSVSNTVAMSVMERTSEIGTSMAIGRTRRQVLVGFLLEGAMLGVVGSVIGVLAGIVLALIVSSIGIPMPPPPGMSRGYVGEIRLDGLQMLNAAVLVTLVGLAGAVFPAIKAARSNIVDALRQGR
ncbi:ABC transporter permease [Nitrogeniibacter aestuarii]|uniref:ABC transporter permease n=1 Tax=Nitrogeniibacter aestuarii TaxID=2815343 RepID=UPI001D11EC7D|nr:FtsX-like permease family protein [Nitrogeniibacter aestuarii]